MKGHHTARRSAFHAPRRDKGGALEQKKLASSLPGGRVAIPAGGKASAANEDSGGSSAVSIDQPRNPLHGITLKEILERLLAKHGWEEMGRRITIRCFTDNPSIQSSLKFLRKTPWARKKVEKLFLEGKG